MSFLSWLFGLGKHSRYSKHGRYSGHGGYSKHGRQHDQYEYQIAIATLMLISNIKILCDVNSATQS
ncbi:hypothetical protein [Providencia stuartii]|uniref:hypothetical protein n=1 Tax=Providencia stuartii TaxID=588 RepID=UPI0029D94423|nr:hypothetical protein [Providencia stuartii]MDX7493302.1 hypothetical protein [Providencia stuartii]